MAPRSRRAGANGRKLAGVLVETVPLGAGRVAIVGVGVNVRAQSVPDAASGFASLDEIDADATPASAVGRVAPALFAALRRFDRDGFAAFAARYAGRDVLRGRSVAGTGADGAIEGVAAGVDGDGALLVATASATVAVQSGEWRLARAEPAGSPC